MAALAAQEDPPVALLCSTPDAFEAASARLTTLRLVAKIAPAMGFDAGP